MSKESIETQLARILNAYSEEVVEALDQSARDIAKETVEELKDTSPKRYGKYAAGWAFRRETTLKGSSYVIHNPKYYRLTHLLEKGHAKINGGRTRAFPHIKPAEQKAIEDYERKIRRKLSR